MSTTPFSPGRALKRLNRLLLFCRERKLRLFSLIAETIRKSSFHREACYYSSLILLKLHTVLSLLHKSTQLTFCPCERSVFFILKCSFWNGTEKCIMSTYYTYKLLALITWSKIERRAHWTLYFKTLMMSKHNEFCNDCKDASGRYRKGQRL